MKQIKTWNLAIAVVVMAMLVASVTTSCSSKSSPTAPSTGGNPGGGTPGPSGDFVVSVSANPSVVNVTDAGIQLSVITVTVRSTSGSLPPNGSIAIVTISPSSAGTLDGPLCNATVAGRYCLPVNNGAASATFTPNAAFTGTVVITAEFSGSSAQTTITVNGPAGPTPTPTATPTPPVFHIDAVSPNVGDPAGGQHVTITGANIENPVKVDFGGVSAQVLSVTPTSITVVVPPHPGVPVGSTQAVSITVINAFGSDHQASDTLVNAFIYSNGGTTQQPQVFSVSPTTGPQTGGTPITIKGSGFQSPVQVLFLIPAPSGTVQLEAPVDNVTGGQIVAHTPDVTQYVTAGTLVAPVTATIKIINLNSGFNTTAGQQFFYGQTSRITSIAPNQGSYLGGTQVTIFGSGFDEPVAVTFAGIAQQVISVAGDQVIVRTVGPLNPPACGGSLQGPTVVTNIEGGSTATGPNFIFIGPQNPVLTGISPSSGNPGSNTTISGNNLPGNGNTRVIFGGADGATAPIVSFGAGTVTVTVPAPPPGFTFRSQACSTATGTGTQQLPTPISVTVRNLTTGCEGTLNNGFTLNPPDGTCVITTPFPTPTPTPTPLPQCSDGIDNDNDGFTDFGGPGADPQCTSSGDNSEST